MHHYKRKYKKSVIAVFIFIVLLAFQTVVFADENEEDLAEIRKLLKEGYFMPVSQEILDKPTIAEILAELDPYTEYFSKQEFGDFKKAVDMNYVGIGIIGEQHEQGVKVDHLFETGAAIHSDLQVEDIIIEVNGNSLAGKTIDEAQGFLLGNPGTTVELKVLRPSTGETKNITIVRKQTEIAPTVESAWLGGNIGYIRLNSFNEDSVSEIHKAMEKIGEVNGWIVDIRDNGGGYLDAAQDVAGLFPKVEIALVIAGQNNEAKLYLSTKQNPQFEEPVFLLTNSESASAAEIVAGAIQDQDGGTLYGQTTYGKGLAQSVFELSSGNFLKMTVAQFYTPDGNAIEGVGIQPDVETEIGAELEIAHQDMLLLDEEEAPEIAEMYNNPLPRNMQFSLTLAEAFSRNSLEERVSLVKLGGKSVDLIVEPISFESFNVMSKKLLEANASYLLLIDLGTKNYVLPFETSDKIEKIEEDEEIFTDVKVDDFFAESATVFYNEGLLNGVGNRQFGPFNQITREQAAVFFTRILNLETDTGSEPIFKDVQPDEYFYKSVAAVHNAGIMKGQTKELFGVGDVLTREEMAALLARAFQLEIVAGHAANVDLPFTDVKASPFKNDIVKIYQSGLVSGTTKSTFSPTNTVTRGEFVTFLYRALLKEKSKASDLDFLSVK